MSEQVFEFSFKVKFARRIPDPVFHKSLGVERHIFFVPVHAVPRDLPNEANARIPNLRRTVYREIRDSLCNKPPVEPNTFHLKHKGITVVAEEVEQKSESEYIIRVRQEQGILDGGHTYALLMEKHREPLPENQFVKFEILTKIPRTWIADLSAGLNTALQVEPQAIDNLRKYFDWIKEELQSEPYFPFIAWKENEDGEYDPRDLVSLLTCFNIYLYPNDRDEHPIYSYSRKAAVLKQFEDNRTTYERLRPILKDILTLHDTIQRDSRRHWNEKGGKFGNLAFVENGSNKPRTFHFRFTGQTSNYRLMNGALYPLLAAFRALVHDNNGQAEWRGGLTGVIGLWEECAAELLRMVAEASTELGRNPNALGKSRNLWANLHARVKLRYLERGVAAA